MIDCSPFCTRIDMIDNSKVLSIELVDTVRGWTYDLHCAEGRVWLTALAEQVPVDLGFALGARAPSAVRALHDCRNETEMALVAQRVLPTSVQVRSKASHIALAA